jgi:hypothetical protein
MEEYHYVPMRGVDVDVIVTIGNLQIYKGLHSLL